MVDGRQHPNRNRLPDAMVAVAMLLTGTSLVLSISSERATTLHYVLLAGCAALFVFVVVRLWRAMRRRPTDSANR